MSSQDVVIVFERLPEYVQPGTLLNALRAADVRVFDDDAVLAAVCRDFQPAPQARADAA